MDTTECVNVADLIERLGGTNAVAQLCGVKFNAVSHWRVNDRIPDRHKFRLFRETQARRVKVAPALFDVPAPVGSEA